MHVLALALVSILSQPAFGQPPGENLQFHVPDGFKMDFQEQQKNMILVEYVPQAESVQNWTEMVTVQVVLGSRTTLEQVLANLQAQPPHGCKDHKVAILGKGQENGYAFLSWSVFCSWTSPVQPRGSRAWTRKGRCFLQPIVLVMARAVHRFDGTVLRTLGDGLKAAFGVPHAREGHRATDRRGTGW